MQIDPFAMSALTSRSEKLAGAKLFGSEFMSAGAAPPSFVCSRLSAGCRTVARLFAGLKCQYKFTTAFKAMLLNHALSYHNDTRIRCSLLNTSVGLKGA